MGYQICESAINLYNMIILDLASDKIRWNTQSWIGWNLSSLVSSFKSKYVKGYYPTVSIYPTPLKGWTLNQMICQESYSAPVRFLLR